MSESFPATGGVEDVDPVELKTRIDDGESVFLLDARASEEYETWRIEGPAVESTNIPYYEFIEGVDDEQLASLPEDREVVVLCAKGGASEYVAEVLLEEGYDAAHLSEGMNGWARIYDAVELTTGDTTVVQYQRPSSGCLAYLVVSDGEAAVVDPLREFTDRYIEDARAYDAELVYAIDTHVHADHISGIRELARDDGVTPVIPAPAVARGVDYDVEYETVAHEDVLSVGEADIAVIHTPGHTTGMTAYRVGDVLFTGDGLFTESVARPDLEEGDDGAPDAARTLYETLQERVLTLPNDVVVAPAHFSDAATPAADGSYTATLDDLVARMDALSMDKETFVEYVLADMPPRPANYEEIIATNLGQYEADDQEAFELELGPNNCAASREAMTSDD